MLREVSPPSEVRAGLLIGSEVVEGLAGFFLTGWSACAGRGGRVPPLYRQNGADPGGVPVPGACKPSCLAKWPVLCRGASACPGAAVPPLRMSPA